MLRRTRRPHPLEHSQHRDCCPVLHVIVPLEAFSDSATVSKPKSAVFGLPSCVGFAGCCATAAVRLRERYCDRIAVFREHNCRRRRLKLPDIWLDMLKSCIVLVVLDIQMQEVTAILLYWGILDPRVRGPGDIYLHCSVSLVSKNSLESSTCMPCSHWRL